MADFGSPTANLPGIDDVLRATSASSTPAPAQPGFIGSALKTGWYGGLSNLANAGRAVSTAVGAPGMGQGMGDWAAQQQANAAQVARPDIDALPFWHPEKLAYQAIQSLPMLAAMTGGTALATAGLAGPDELIAGGAGAAALSAAARTAAIRGAAGAGAAAYPFMVGQNVEAGDQAGQPLDQGAAGKALALDGQQRRVGGEDDDDGPRAGRRRAHRRHDVGADLAADGNAIDTKQIALAIIRLHQRTDGQHVDRLAEGQPVLHELVHAATFG